MANGIESRIRAVASGDAQARFDLGVAFSWGTGVPVDLVEAHKWFNPAVLVGSGEAQHCRAEIAGEMTAREIVQTPRMAQQELDRAHDLPRLEAGVQLFWALRRNGVRSSSQPRSSVSAAASRAT